MFGWNSPSSSGEDVENVKNYTDRRTTDKMWSGKFTWAFSLGDLKTLYCQIALISIICLIEAIQSIAESNSGVHRDTPIK